MPLPMLTSEHTGLLSVPARKLPKEQWDLHREMIKTLYHVKGVTAKDIMMLLQTRGFTVTERQLKRKIGDWKLDKNIKRDEMEIIIHKQQRRRKEKGKGTIIRVRGRPVPQAKIERFLKRNQGLKIDYSNDTSLDTVLSPTPSSPTLSVISYETSSEMDCLSPRPSSNTNSPASSVVSVSNFALHKKSLSRCGISISQSLEDAAKYFPNYPSLYAREAIWQLSISDDQCMPENIQANTSINGRKDQILSSSLAFIVPKSFQDCNTFKVIESVDMRAEEFTLRQKHHLLRMSHGPKHQKTLECLLELGHYLVDQGGSASAEETLTSEISKIGGMSIDDPNPIALRLYLVIAQSLILQSKDTIAVCLLRTLLDKACRRSTPSSIQIEIMLSYGNFLHTCGDVVGGESIIKQSIDIGGRFLAPDHSLMLNAFRLLAKSLRLQGNFCEAEKVLRVVAQSPNAVYGKNYRYNLSAFCELGVVLRLQHKYQEAERLLQIVVAKQLHILGVEHKVTIFSQLELGIVRAYRHRDPSMIREAYCQATDIFGRSHWLSTYAGRALASWLSLDGQLNEAEAILDQVLVDCMTVNEVPTTEKCMAERLLGQVHHMQGQLEKAVSRLESAFAWSGQAFGLGHPYVKQIWGDLVVVLREKVMRKSLEIDEVSNPNTDRNAEWETEAPGSTRIICQEPSAEFRSFIEL